MQEAKALEEVYIVLVLCIGREQVFINFLAVF